MCKYQAVHDQVKIRSEAAVRHFNRVCTKRAEELQELAVCADIMSDKRKLKHVSKKDIDACLRFPPKTGEWINVYKASNALGLKVSSVFHQIYKGKLSARRFINKDNLKVELHVLQSEVLKARKKKK